MDSRQELKTTSQLSFLGDSVVWRLQCLTSTSELAGSNLSLGTLCWKVGCYLPIPSGLQWKILTNANQIIILYDEVIRYKQIVTS